MTLNWIRCCRRGRWHFFLRYPYWKLKNSSESCTIFIALMLNKISSGRVGENFLEYTQCLIFGRLGDFEGAPIFLVCGYKIVGDIIWPLTTFGPRCNVDYHESFVLHFAQFSGMESFSISILEMEIWNRVFYRSEWMEETMKGRMAGLLELDPKARFSTFFFLLWHVVLLNVFNYKKQDDTKSGSGSHSAAPDKPIFVHYNVF